jgi:three-Cys-motif partner protein
MTEFFSMPTCNSQIKQLIVAAAFKLWLTENKGQKELSYIDLFSGPGIYADGSFSTPLIILQDICSSETMARKFNVIFNDSDIKSLSKLRKAINGIKNIQNLKLILTSCNTVDKNILEKFPKIETAHSFAFIDPWGYKGVCKSYLKTLLELQNCEIVLLFSFNQLNRFLSFNGFDNLLSGLFDGKSLKQLRKQCKVGISSKNEADILDTFIAGIAAGSKNCFAIPFRFSMENYMKTSHYIVFIVRNEPQFVKLKNKLEAFETCPLGLLCYSKKCMETNMRCTRKEIP